MALDRVSIQMIDNTGASNGEVLTQGASGLEWAPVAYEEVLSANPWADGPAFTRVSDATFTVTDNATNQGIFCQGRPLRYKGTSYVYGIVTDYSSGTVTIAGAPMTTDYDDTIQYGDMFRVQQIVLSVAGACLYAASTTLLSSYNHLVMLWGGGTAYVVRMSLYAQDDDSGANQPRVNVYVNGSAVLTDNSNAGLEVVEDTWVHSAATVNISNYDLQFGEGYELSTDAHGSNGDAGNITALVTLVMQ